MQVRWGFRKDYQTVIFQTKGKRKRSHESVILVVTIDTLRRIAKYWNSVIIKPF